MTTAPHKPVIITGSSSGIGFETAKMLSQDPTYRLVLVGKNREKLEESAKELGGLSEKVAVIECDLSQSEEVQRTIDKILMLHKQVYGLVNNAGIYPFGGVTNTTEVSWDEAMQVNLKAPFLFMKGLSGAMAKHPDGGRVVNVSSTAGILPNHFALAYSVSKAALIQLSKTAAKEMGKDNITVNCVCPGIVRSPLHEAYHRNETELEEFYAKRGAAFPLGRVGEASDVASAIRYFLSPEASWVTGDVFVIDGGRLLL